MNIKIAAIGFAAIAETLGFVAVFLLNNSAGWILIILGATAFFAGLFTNSHGRG
jgi:membrane-bound ClpP family serine protease